MNLFVYDNVNHNDFDTFKNSNVQIVKVLRNYNFLLNFLKVSVLEKVWDHGRSLLEVRESKYIRDFMTEIRGINRKK